jgi:hypothetical protein
VKLFRRRGGGRAGELRQADSGDERHLREFARTHHGVEAYVEPPTAVMSTTVVLVAGTGEWTRRRVANARAAHHLANGLGVPSYDAAVVGYPRRMREWDRSRASRSVPPPPSEPPPTRSPSG